MSQEEAQELLSEIWVARRDTLDATGALGRVLVWVLALQVVELVLIGWIVWWLW